MVRSPLPSSASPMNVLGDSLLATVTQHTGLTSADAAARMARGEGNTVKPFVERTYWQIIVDNIFNLFNIVLLILSVILLYFHDYGAIFCASFSVISNSLIGTLQEISAKRALDRLAALAVRDVQVWRDGKLVSLPIGQVVKDDVLPIEPGVRIVVDGKILESDSLEMDESLLSGESDAVLKEPDSPVYSGSFCTAGSGRMVATQVGEASTVNNLSRIAKAYRNVKTPTQRKVDAFVQLAVVGMLIFGPLVIVAGVVSDLVPLETMRNALVLVTSFVPQGLVLLTTLSLTLAAIRISRHQTLVKRINAVESLANVNVLCFDKTGTLTRNELTVVDLIALAGQTPEALRAQLALYTCNLAYQNRTATAIAAYCTNQPGADGHPPAPSARMNPPVKQREIPFSSARKWGALVFADQTLILGAPERVLDRQQHQDAIEQAVRLSSDGLRVLAFACADHPLRDGTLDEARVPLALVVLSDQVRDDIRQTLQTFREQQVELKVISGDNLETVKAIAGQAGIQVRYAYAGDALEKMTPDELATAVRNGNLFARIEPDTKRKIVTALKQQGAYVAMVGDGVNDVPALKEAHLAIAMNGGADIARDVADIVLLNNAMSTLPLAFAEGQSTTQKIYGTTRLFPRDAQRA